MNGFAAVLIIIAVILVEFYLLCFALGKIPFID